VQDVQQAAAYVREKGVGVRAALATGHFPAATKGKVEWELRRNPSNDDSARDANTQVLTNAERLKLASWILARADAHDPQTRHQISVQVRRLLSERYKFNKSRKFGKGSIPLNTNELNHVNSDVDLSHTFFQRIYPWWRARGINISEGVSRAEEERRSRKRTEVVVQNHFFGEYGLERELIDAGIMDPHTKVINDPRRILNGDETPQPLDVPQRGRRAKVAKRKGCAVRQRAGSNKEQITVMMTWDASGWNYGAQLVVKRKWATADLVVEAPEGECTFDD